MSVHKDESGLSSLPSKGDIKLDSTAETEHFLGNQDQLVNKEMKFLSKENGRITKPFTDRNEEMPVKDNDEFIVENGKVDNTEEQMELPHDNDSEFLKYGNNSEIPEHNKPASDHFTQNENLGQRFDSSKVDNIETKNEKSKDARSSGKDDMDYLWKPSGKPSRKRRLLRDLSIIVQHNAARRQDDIATSERIEDTNIEPNEEVKCTQFNGLHKNNYSADALNGHGETHCAIELNGLGSNKITRDENLLSGNEDVNFGNKIVKFENESDSFNFDNVEDSPNENECSISTVHYVNDDGVQNGFPRIERDCPKSGERDCSNTGGQVYPNTGEQVCPNTSKQVCPNTGDGESGVQDVVETKIEIGGPGRDPPTPLIPNPDEYV